MTQTHEELCRLVTWYICVHLLSIPLGRVLESDAGSKPHLQTIPQVCRITRGRGTRVSGNSKGP